MAHSKCDNKKARKNRPFYALFVFLSVSSPANAWHAMIDIKKDFYD
jgi:hypothetical protein